MPHQTRTVPLPEWLDANEFPFTWRELRLDGHRIRYIDEGQGPTLLFVHVGPVWSFLFRNIIKELRGTFRCIAIDLPATGASTPAPGFANKIEPNARVLARALDALDLHDVIGVPHDLGGPVLFRVATQDPKRFQGFVVTDTFAFPLTDFPKVKRMLRIVTSPPIRFIHKQTAFLPKVVARATADPPGTDPKAKRAGYLGPYHARAVRNRWQPAFRDAVDQDALLADVERGLRRHFGQAPILMMYGEKDPGREVGFDKRMARLFPQGQSVVVPNGTHFPHEDDPAFMARAIRQWATKRGLVPAEADAEAPVAKILARP